MLFISQAITNERGTMKSIFTGLVGAALVIGSLGAASTAAQAYDREAFAFAASHFLSPKDLPKAFAAKPAMSVQVMDSGRNGSYVCTSPTPNGPDVKMSRTLRSAFASYDVVRRDLNLFISVNEFKNNVAAEEAFAKLTKDIKKCEGNYTGSWTSDDGTVYPYQNIVTTGKIPAVTVAGVASIFVNQNSSNAAVGDSPVYLNDALNIYTLVNDAIINTQGLNSRAVNVTAAQKKSLEKVAFDMVTTWVD
jgi:hypothetical protein